MGTLPKDLGSVRLPTFEADPSDGLGHLAAALSPAIHATTMSTPPTQPQLRSSLEASHYSATNRLPQKLVTRIQALEFIEMSEMLPETWLPDHQEMATAPRRPSRNTPVTDILVWTECFSLMAAVLAERYPDKAPQLLAYLRRIVHAARNFHGMAWVAYDRLYRRQALAQRSLDWAREDASLYNEAFVGQAKAISRCRHCLSDNHTAEACPELVQSLPPWMGLYPYGAPPHPYTSVQSANPTQEICRKFNENRCFMRKCKYAHVCLNCGHPHPAALCGSTGGPPRVWQTRGRERSPPPQYQGRRAGAPGQRR